MRKIHFASFVAFFVRYYHGSHTSVHFYVSKYYHHIQSKGRSYGAEGVIFRSMHSGDISPKIM